MSYSLDDVVPPPAEQRFDGSLAAWMSTAHVMWTLVFAALGATGGGPILLAGAAAHCAGLVLVVVAWSRRFPPSGFARAVAWTSTGLLSLALACLALALVVLVGASFADYGEPGPEMLAIVWPVLLVVIVVSSVPTALGFAAAVSLARSVRSGRV